MATIFRSPIFVRLFRRPPKQPDAYVNPLALREPNPAQPFTQTDWPRSAPRRQPLKSDYALDLLALLQSNPAQPFHQDDWPSTARRKTFQSDIFVNLVPVQNPPAAADPFFQTDWPTPALRVLTHGLRDFLGLSILVQITPTPGKVYGKPERRYQTTRDLADVFDRYPRQEQDRPKAPERRKPEPIAPPDTAFADQLRAVRERLEMQAGIQAEIEALRATELAVREAETEEDILIAVLALALWP